jgi:hypothetical protein
MVAEQSNHFDAAFGFERQNEVDAFSGGGPAVDVVAEEHHHVGRIQLRT